MTARSATIIGGGISGLVAAFDLQRAGWNVTLHEASDRFGGKIWSSPVGDRLVDAGPDTFLARVPEGRQLCEDLGLADQLTSPVAPVPAYFHRNGQLHRLPTGTVLGVPTDLDALAESGLVSPEGVARAALDLELEATPIDGDISVGEYFRARLGDEVTGRLIDPMIGGINASDIDRLSLASASPQIARAAASHRSIIEGLRAAQAGVGATLGSQKPGAGGTPDPVFYGLPGGIASLTDSLVAALGESSLHLDSPVTDLSSVMSDHIIIATPTPSAARLLEPVAPTAADLLASIEYSSVAQVTIEIPKSAIAASAWEHGLDAAGILFPRVDGMIITAATFFSTKWAHYDRPDTALIRMTSGRFGDTRALELSDDELTATLFGELRSVVEITGDPTATRVHRWIDALPQYTPGHAQRVVDINAALVAESPNCTVVGAPYQGIGIPACIGLARGVAHQLIDA